MVVLRMPPLHVCVEPVVSRSPLIFLFEALFRALRPLTVFLDDALCPLFHACMNEYVQAVSLILKDEIRAAADDHAGAFICQFLDDPALDAEHFVLIRQSCAAVREHSREPSSVLCFLFYVFRGISALLRYFLDQLRVVARNAEFFRDQFSDCSSAAAKFTADCDDSVLAIRNTAMTRSFLNHIYDDSANEAHTVLLSLEYNRLLINAVKLF